MTDLKESWTHPDNHKYTVHHTYTGTFCAICGLPVYAHRLSLDEQAKDLSVDSGKAPVN